MRRLVAVWLTLLTVALIWAPTSSVQADEAAFVPALVILNGTSPITAVQARIDALGGRAIHIFPGQALIIRLAAQELGQLATEPAIIEIYTQIIDPMTIAPALQPIVAVWNDLLLPTAVQFDTSLQATDHTTALHDDAFDAPDLVSQPRVSDEITPGYFQTSEFMVGSVAVGVILVESDGSIDPSTEDWSAEEKSKVFTEVVAGLNWWAELEPRANLSFVYDDHFTNPLRISLEPISRPYTDQKTWISEAMNRLGYDEPFYFTQVRDYNVALREAYGTDWAFTIFIVDSEIDSDNRFSDGYFAYAYRSGPFMVLTSGNNGYGPDNLEVGVAHEMGHIFGALDQYSSAKKDCTERAGYLDIENQNSLYGPCSSNVSSIMRGQIAPYAGRSLDPFAAGQIGWRDSDGDDIFDPVDTSLPLTIDQLAQDDNNVTVQGSVEIQPYPAPSRTSVTINNLTQVQYRLNNGPWQPALADDGAFDGLTESFNFTTKIAEPGRYWLEVAAFDSAGNMSEPDVSQISVLDPIDGGLITELNSVSGEFIAGQDNVVVEGLTYQLENKAIAQVEYRVNGDQWQHAAAQDGAFDSPEEAFQVTLGTLYAGTYLVEVRAGDAEGQIEVDFASQQFTVLQNTTQVEPLSYQLFLPVLIR